MHVGVISDIHANRIALESVLADMPAVDLFVCAGDVVGYNPWPAECVAEIRSREVPTVLGNHDRAVVEGSGFWGNEMADAGVQYAIERLNEREKEWLAGLPETRAVADGRIGLVHGHPDDPDCYTYPESFSASMLGEEELLVLGHTHVQGHRVYDEGIVCNPGSVGQPRDGDPRAAYAIVDLDTKDVEERRVEYDVDAVVEAIEEARLPKRTGERLYRGK
ncbi:metallophosphoesterase family protein [Natronorarus salvus]|uniref:metallophosphoesterase family protein n=1 Tax=Natronorarus salvus TaxID=3117733 RepID=UPI002F25F26E